MQTDILIAGGGIAGLTTAIALKHIGINATLAEAAPEFKPVGAGITLAANAMSVYHQLGLYDKILNAGKSIGEMQVRNQRGKIISQVNADKFKNGLSNIAISRPALHQVLLNELDHSAILTGKRSSHFTQNGNQITVHFDDQTSITCNTLIVAEGIHSAIRSQLIPDAIERYSGYTCWRGITDQSLAHIQNTSETWGTQGRFGIVPIGNGQIYWFACKTAPANDSTLRLWKKNELKKCFVNYSADILEVLEHAHNEHIVHHDIVDLKPIHQFAFGNMLLIGDAAHATTPNMGQGACQAIEDALMLAHCLQQHTNREEAFTAFEKNRMKRVHSIVNKSWQLGKIAQTENKFLAGLRNFMFQLTPALVLEKQLKPIYGIELPVLKK